MGCKESEFVVPPGCCWRVESKCNAGSGLTIVQLTELPDKSMLTFKPPGSLFPLSASAAPILPAAAPATSPSVDDAPFLPSRGTLLRAANAHAARSLSELSVPDMVLIVRAAADDLCDAPVTPLPGRLPWTGVSRLLRCYHEQ
jgi:hypothetical protein